MTIPEYDENCNCDLCVTLRNERNKSLKERNKKRIKEEIDRVCAEHAQGRSTGTDLMGDCFR